MAVYEVVARTCFALMIGTVIGLERERKHRPAGMRTQICKRPVRCLNMFQAAGGALCVSDLPWSGAV